jgi:hypothetical protein
MKEEVRTVPRPLQVDVYSCFEPLLLLGTCGIYLRYFVNMIPFVVHQPWLHEFNMLHLFRNAILRTIILHSILISYS